MEINRAAFGALAVIGVVAAGGGAYLANRHNDPVPVMVQPASFHSAPTPGVVTETENTIAPAPPPSAAPAPSAAPTPNAERAESPTERVDTAPAARNAPVRPASPARRTAAPVRPGERGTAERGTADRARTARRAETSSSPTYSPSVAPVDPEVSAAIEPLDTTTVERAPAVVQEAPRKTLDELVIPADSVIGLQIETAVSSDRAKLEDQVRARVTRDVRVRDRVAIPAGARAEGSITLVERGGRLKDQARLGIRFHTIVLNDGTRLPINTDTVYREGDSPARESAAKIGGGAVGGAVLGAILGGKKGAIIGSTVGAAGGGVAVATSEPNLATLPAGSTVTVRMGSPAAVTVER